MIGLGRRNLIALSLCVCVLDADAEGARPRSSVVFSFVAVDGSVLPSAWARVALA